MMDNKMICTEGFENVVHEGKTVGFSFLGRLPYYRGLGLSMIENIAVAERTDNPDADPGVVWEDLNVDLLVVDEAQNFKILWPVEDREGGIPRYLGAISEGSQRAWDLAGTRPSKDNPDPDWTRGVRMSWTDRANLILEDGVSLRDGPSEVEDLVMRTTRLDADEARVEEMRTGRASPPVEVTLWQDPAQAASTRCASSPRVSRATS